MPEPAPSPPSTEQLRALVRGGTRIALAAQVASQLASLVVLAILYRLLRPEDYGLLGMVLPAVMLPRMAVTLGIGAAIVQAPELSGGQKTSLFWLLQGAGVAAALVTAALGAAFAPAYGQPELFPLSLALGGATLLATLGQAHQSLLERRLAFKPLAAARLVAQLGGGVAAIASAWRGLGVWSLVVQQIVELAISTAMVWCMAPWIPGTPTRGERIGGLGSFSGYFAATNLVFYIGQNLEKLLFPWLLGSSADLAIGLFSQAMTFVLRIVTLFTTAFSAVMMPALARARHDRRLFAELIARFFRMTAIGLFPCGIGLFLVAPEVMLLLGGEKWASAGRVLQALAPLMLVQGFLNLTGSIFGALGQGRRLLAGSLLVVLLLAQGIVAGWLASTGFRGELVPTAASIDRATLWMAAAYTLVTIVAVFGPYVVFCLRSAQVAPRPILRPLLAPLRAALAMGLVVWLAGRGLDAAGATDYRLRLAVMVPLGGAAFALIARDELRWLRPHLVGRGEDRESPLEDSRGN